MATAHPLPGDESSTPVFVLTGFLGSGKTTLLSRLVRDPGMADTAVVVNEFGEIGLDHALIEAGEEDDVVLLDSGCLCCAANNAIAETLSDLFHRRGRRAVPPFSRVVIETSGLADPAPILHGLMTDRYLAARFHIASVIATVDALHAADQVDRYAEVAKQIAVADRIVLTKTDAASADQAAAAERRVAALNPHADRLTVVLGAVAPEVLLAPAALPRAAAADGAESGHDPSGRDHAGPDHAGHDHGGHDDHGHRRDADPGHRSEDGGPGRAAGASAVTHTSGVLTVSVPVDRPVTWPAYAAMVRAIQEDLGERALRVKGALLFEGEDQPRAIQGVQHVFAPPAEVDRPGRLGTGLVFILRDAEEAEVAAVLRRLLPDGASAQDPVPRAG